jgi:ceramide glucosyltransferase
MGINQHFLPDVLFAIRYGLAAPCFGSTIALTKDVLGEIGGLSRFSEFLADDHEIGRAVRSRGYRVALPAMTVTHWCSERSATDLLRHELRWARTIRVVNPIGFAASIITYGMPLGLLGCLLAGFTTGPVGAFGFALAARFALAVRINAFFGTRDPIWLVPLRDLLSFVVFFGALFTTRVEWRGARFRVSSAGALAQD